MFWGEASEQVAFALPARWTLRGADDADAAADGGSVRDLALTAEVAVVVSLAVALVAFGIGFEGVYQSAHAAANAALDTGTYVDAVAPEVFR